MTRESFVPGNCDADAGSPDDIALRTFVSQACGATGFSTGTATFEPEAVLPYHLHGCSEAITVLSGEALVVVAGRGYRLGRLDCMHLPAGVPHMVQNPQAGHGMVAHWSFASADPQRTFIDPARAFEDRGLGKPRAGDPEHLRRFADAEAYELADGAWFRDLFAQRFGAAGICGGYGRFRQGSSLPCHTHAYDESITILTGDATCMVQGSRYEMTGMQTAFVPQGKPHRFLNSGESEMEMLWVYAGDEPDRLLVDPGYCSGSRAWPPGDKVILSGANDA